MACPSLLRTPSACFTALTACALLALLPVAALAVQLPAQGALLNAAGGPAPDGSYVLVFRLYDTAEAKAPLWEEVFLKVTVVHGRFDLLLGASSAKVAFPKDFFATQPDLWLGVQVAGDPEFARQKLGTVPYAAHAQTAGALAGKLSGAQILPGSLPNSALSFVYANSDTKGGDALGLQCTGCITAGHLHPDALAGVAKTGEATTFAKKLTALGPLGAGKVAADGCSLDVASDNGPACIDGAPGLWTRLAANDAEMNKFKQNGQIVFRTDTGDAWLFKKGAWRKLLVQAICGDGAIDVPEQCDDANTKEDDGCTAACLHNVCGDLKTWVGKEECDDGNTVETDACVGCKKAACGDGVVQGGVEACDGSNLGVATCASVKGAGWAGKLACKGDCKAFDTAGCSLTSGTQANPAASCLAILQGGASTGNGLYWLKTGAAAAYETYCDMVTQGGGWTLVASVHEDNIAAKCDAKDRWSSTKGNSASLPGGDGNWENTSNFGGAAAAASDDFKAPGYWEMKAANVLVYHVPNGSAVAKFHTDAILRYFTSDGFLGSHGHSMYALFKDKFPVKFGGSCGQTGPAPAISWDKGDNAKIDSLIAPNTVGESTPGFLHFRVFNNEQGANAVCPGIKYDGCNTEHACLGGGGWFPEGNPAQCGDFSGWGWDGAGSGSGWSSTKAMLEATVFFFYR